MKLSNDRILTTFAGSLARPSELLGLMRAKESGQPYDFQALAEGARLATRQLWK